MKNYTITVNGVAYNVTVEENDSSSNSTSQAVPSAPAKAAVPSAPSAAGSIKVEAPMPGNILDVKISAGDKVSANQVLIILEAMKMENEIVSPQDAAVVSVSVKKGDTVDAGQILVTLN